MAFIAEISTMKMKLFFSMFFLLSGFFVSSAQERELLQLSGMVFNENSEPVKYAHIVSKTTHRGTITDTTGLFTIITHKNDTILFSCMGYKPTYYVVPQKLDNFYYTIDVVMEHDTIMLEEVIILPWKTYEEFKEAFLSLRIPEGDYEHALRNIAIIQIQIKYDDTPYPGVAYKQAMNQQIQKSITYGQYPVNNLLNPMAWAKFFNELKKGKLKRYIPKEEKKTDKDR